MATVINVGVIGLGHWGPNYVRNFSGIEGVRVKCVCDLDKVAIDRIRRMYPSVEATRDYLEMLEDPAITAVVVATPATTHYAIARDCLERGKHVLVEKPLALRREQGQHLAVLAARRGLVLMVGYTFLFNPAVRAVKEILDRGELGDIYYVHARRTNLGPVRDDVNAMWDLASHDISICAYLLERWPDRVAAQGGIYLQPGLPDVAFLTMFYGEVLANVHVSWLDPKKTRQITIVGSQKMAVFDDLDDTGPVRIYDRGVLRERYQREYTSFEEFKLIVRDGSVVIPEVPQQEPLRNQCLHFIECVRTKARPSCDGEFGIDMIDVLMAAQTSLDRGGIPVSLGPLSEAR